MLELTFRTRNEASQFFNLTDGQGNHIAQALANEYCYVSENCSPRTIEQAYAWLGFEAVQMEMI